MNLGELRDTKVSIDACLAIPCQSHCVSHRGEPARIFECIGDGRVKKSGLPQPKKNKARLKNIFFISSISMERLIPLESFFQSAIPSGLTGGTQSNASLASSKCFRPSSTAVAWSSSKATKDIQQQKQQQHKTYNHTNTKSTTTVLLPGASLALRSTTILMAQKFLIAGIFYFCSFETGLAIFEHF